MDPAHAHRAGIKVPGHPAGRFAGVTSNQVRASAGSLPTVVNEMGYVRNCASMPGSVFALVSGMMPVERVRDDGRIDSVFGSFLVSLTGLCLIDVIKYCRGFGRSDSNLVFLDHSRIKTRRKRLGLVIPNLYPTTDTEGR